MYSKGENGESRNATYSQPTLTTVVPEPATLICLCGGLLTLVRRKNNI